MKFIVFAGLILLMVLSLLYYEWGEITGNVVAEQPYTLEVYFCPTDDCETVLINFLDSASQRIHCALFDIGLESVQNKLIEKSKVVDVKVVTDNDYLKKFNTEFVKADSHGLMHNKFCIVDNKVSTGSMNPTLNGVSRNNNNLLIIEHSGVVENFEAEFQELWLGEFKGGEKVSKQHVLETYFCPEDNCAEVVKRELKKAQESIYFMTFSFTHEEIANILLLKDLDGVDVKGIMETRQVSKYSQFDRLNYNGIEVIKDSNKNNMHHKVFVIDSETVITGSFNPTEGGDRRNDENIIVIRNREIAGSFINEFNSLYSTKK